MIITAQMNEALNRQIGNELAASNHYVGTAAYFDSESLPELASLYFRQAEEERAHAMRFVHFVLAAGGRVHIPAVPDARSDYASAEEAVRSALDGEKVVTTEINGLIELAQREGDHITENALQWFVTEQLEEVSSADTLLKIVRRAGEQGLLQVEDYVARRRPGGADARAATGAG